MTCIDHFAGSSMHDTRVRRFVPTYHLLGVQSATSIDAWDTMGDGLTDIDFPVLFASKIEVSAVKRSVEIVHDA